LGKDGLALLKQGKQIGDIKLTKHEHKVEKYLREKDIIITPRQIGKAEPRKPIEIALDLYKCVNDIFDNIFTDKEREGFVSWFACDRSLRKAGKQLKIDPKSLHARLFGDSRGGGAIRKVRNNPRLRELAWEAGILKNLPKTPPTK
jgi:hypothetical protein